MYRGHDACESVMNIVQALKHFTSFCIKVEEVVYRGAMHVLSLLFTNGIISIMKCCCYGVIRLTVIQCVVSMTFTSTVAIIIRDHITITTIVV